MKVYARLRQTQEYVTLVDVDALEDQSLEAIAQRALANYKREPGGHPAQNESLLVVSITPTEGIS